MEGLEFFTVFLNAMFFWDIIMFQGWGTLATALATEGGGVHGGRSAGGGNVFTYGGKPPSPLSLTSGALQNDGGVLVAAQEEQYLHELAKVDPVSAVLEFIEKVKTGDCTSSETLLDFKSLPDFKYTIPSTSYKRFTAQTLGAIKTANVLNNLFRTWDMKPNSLYNDAFYYSLTRAMVESDKDIYGGGIAFESSQYNNRQDFCPYIYRDKVTGALHVKDLGALTKGNYTYNGTKGFEWVWGQRTRDFSNLLRDHQKICKELKPEDEPKKIINSNVVVTTAEVGLWTDPYYDCAGGKTWMVTYSVPFFGCDSHNIFQYKGVVAINIDLNKVDINQCAEDDTLFSKTHRCHENSTQCVPVSGLGFRRGSYKCECKPGFYFPHHTNQGPDQGQAFFNGSEVEKSYLEKLLNKSDIYEQNFQCLPCHSKCDTCNSSAPCFAEMNVMMRGIPLGIQSFCMTISLVLGFVILRLRRSKVMKASMWPMLEIVLLGALLLYSTVVIQYFDPSIPTCLLIPWCREVGFAVVYGALILKVYRVLAEFQSRKAHRVHVRDRDLLKYLLGLVMVVIGYMSAWTAVNMDHVREGANMVAIGRTPEGLKYESCREFWWDYVIEVGEFMFLVFGMYLCYCIRTAPSDYGETRFISWAIYNETFISAIVHIIRHFLWLKFHPDYIFMMYFLRCQTTVTITLILVLGPKLWYAHRPPVDEFRTRAYSSSDVHDTILPESMKLHVGISSNGDVDVGEINLSEMDPEDIRMDPDEIKVSYTFTSAEEIKAELKRLYTQLQIYKTKTMRKDNPHISKRRGGRKTTHRRFSLTAFHYKHKHHHSSADHGHDDHELSKTPEESTNSAEGVAISMDCSSRGDEESMCSRTPTVTFKPGHKSFS